MSDLEPQVSIEALKTDGKQVYSSTSSMAYVIPATRCVQKGPALRT